MMTNTTSLEQVAERISEYICLAKWEPHASLANHPLRYYIAHTCEGDAFIVADDFGVEIHQINSPGIRKSRPQFVLTTQYGCDNGNPETEDVVIDESRPLPADRAAIMFVVACFERYLMRQACRRIEEASRA